MAKLKFQGSATGTGTVTLVAPTTDSTRTITLPDGDISLGVGIDDNATSTAITIDTSENVQFNGSAPKVQIGTSAVSTGATALEIGNGRTGNGNSYIDIISDTTYSDYGFRIIRGNTGANAATTLTNRGTGDLTIQTEEAGAIAFKTGAVEEMRILPAGGITFNGDTAAANALDDYEEGTWTPVVYGATTAGSYIYGYQYGKYTKIGNMVHYTLNIYTTGGTAGTGEIRISGLPFTNTADRNYCMAATDNSHSAATTGISFYVQPGTTYLRGVHNIDADTAFELRVTGAYNIN